MYMYNVYVGNKSTLRDAEIDSVNTKGFEVWPVKQLQISKAKKIV